MSWGLRSPDADLRLVPGDELRLSLPASFSGRATEWAGSGHVREIVDGEVTLEMSGGDACPTDATAGFVVEMVWKSARCVVALASMQALRV
jgi:hypothetical protein